jgi:FkbH-like protein
MKLMEALRLLNAARRAGHPLATCSLACGFTPLHFESFLAAHLQAAHPDREIRLRTGLFGDLVGNITRATAARESADIGAAIVIEWSDLDPRLGWRGSGGWRVTSHNDIVVSARDSLSRIVAAIADLAVHSPAIAVILPHLALPPVAYTPMVLLSTFEAELYAIRADAARTLAAMRNVRVANPLTLDRLAPLETRADAAADLNAGFPFSQGHADVLASTLAGLMLPATPKKGLVTDLDDTMWRGILGDVGVGGVSNTLEGHAQGHALYQQLLASLADAGVLLAIASKNDASLVQQALSRPEQLVAADQFFPIEAHWRPKSESIAAILQTWNVGADSVVFVDDSPMELAEVQARFPDIECVLFPKDKPSEIVATLFRLREFFGKRALQEEDRLRLDSIRGAQALADRRADSGNDIDGFLEGVDAEITFSIDAPDDDERALELINKTNQFNLNGRRLTDAVWRQRRGAPHQHRVVVSYRDRFGPLGKIGVLLLDIEAQRAVVSTWVLSCRAFSRRIEHRTLQMLFEHFQVDSVQLDFVPTDRNAPTREFLDSLSAARDGSPAVTFNRAGLLPALPSLHQRVHIHHGTINT